MKPKLVALNLILVALVGATIWEGHARWSEGQAVRKANLNVPVRPVAPPPMAPVPEPMTPPATTYADVAKNNLFSSDRNDEIIVDPPKVEAVKQMPALPISTGVMRVPSGVKAFMAAKSGETPRMVKVDDTVGEFRILALDERDVTFEWNGQQIKRKIEDLIDRSGHDQVSGATQATAAPAAPPAPGPNVPPPPPAAGQKTGVVLTESTRACRPGDTSAAGASEDGYRKVITPSPFGPVCRWIKQ